MPKPRSAFSAAFLLLMLANFAWADEDPNSPDVPDGPTQPTAQVIYKGVIGNVLDTLPMDPAHRVDLQRANAVVSNTISGRSLATLIGMSNPILMIGGLVWGLWSASNIQPVAVETKAALRPVNAGVRVETKERLVTIAESLPAEKSRFAGLMGRTGSLALNSFAGSGPSEASRPPVIRVWLPQRLGDPAN